MRDLTRTYCQECGQDDSAEAERDEAVAALREYGRHKTDCYLVNVHSALRCTCGLDARLSTPKEPTDD